MAITFYRLWDKMNRTGVSKMDLREVVSPATVAKLSKNGIVTTETINKLCTYLNCNPEDILEFEPDEQKKE